MVWTLLCLIAVMLVAWYWLANIRCREFGLTAAQSTCQSYGCILLDESVAMIAWRPVLFSVIHPCIKRIYEFEYTRSGTERGFARITLLGHHLVGNTSQIPNITVDHRDNTVISLAHYQASRYDNQHPDG